MLHSFKPTKVTMVNRLLAIDITLDTSRTFKFRFWNFKKSSSNRLCKLQTLNYHNEGCSRVPSSLYCKLPLSALFLPSDNTVPTVYTVFNNKPRPRMAKAPYLLLCSLTFTVGDLLASLKHFDQI